MRIDLQRLFSMVPREEELETLLGPLDAKEVYEIHITVKSDGEIEQFRECCAELEVKPLVVQLSNGEVPDDVMTSSTFEGTPSELRDECVRILIGLEVMEWHTVRCKVECAPFHSKVKDVQPHQILPSQYFESHIPVVVGREEDVGSLRVLCRCLDIHMSANAFKVDDEVRTIMLTYRSSNYNVADYRKEVLHRMDTIRGALFNATTPIVEFAIFDSNREHDNEWLSKKFVGVDNQAIKQMVSERLAYVEKSLNLG